MPPKLTVGESQQNHRASPVPNSDADADRHSKMDKMIDLNMKPHRMHEQASNNQVRLIIFSATYLFIYLF